MTPPSNIEWISNKGIQMHIKEEKRNIHITNTIRITNEYVSFFENKKKNREKNINHVLLANIDL